MIHFSCSCGMKFKVKDEYAGRSTKCPTCKQALMVPMPDATVAAVPQGQIEGTQSSLVQAGVDGGVTVGQEIGSPGQLSVDELLACQTKKGQRYIIEQEIARGGMGAVLRAVDCDIRREVAVKYMLGEADPKKKLRFIEEAQITGQLEHPNIVPIHELGVDKEKRVFFSMKMVKGRSLAEVLDELRKNPKKTDFSLSRLLNIFVNVCNGLAYAHSRGVVHRDLKPANFMVGDFGEVYVMDWGLAKVLAKREAIGSPPTEAADFARYMGQKASAPMATGPTQTGKVATSREPDADLTQEGAILGTPAYMPPEQAMGKIDAIDQRSDIYSLGAILYEMLTLQAPIDKEGGYLAILMRVTQGEIVVPEKRTRSRSIPRELSAIAMKAMAKNPQDRYQNVESLRKDIERYQEGRSVSAKEDSFKEMAWKLVKRNKGASAASFIGLLVLAVVVGIGFVLVNNSRLRAESNLTAFQDEQKRRHKENRNSAPLFYQDAQASTQRGKLEHGLAQVNVALDYDPEMAEARLLKGQLLLVQQAFPEALTELELYQKQQPNDTDANEMIRLCRKVGVEDHRTILPLVDILVRQNAFTLAEHLQGSIKGLEQAEQRQLELYRKRIESAWPGLGSRLTMDKHGKYSLWLGNCKQVADLTPLQGMPLTTLLLNGCSQVRDLTALKGMPLTTLNLYHCVQVRDLTPLQGMKLISLDLEGVQVRDLSPLKGMPLTSLNLGNCLQVRDLTPLKGMQLRGLRLSNCEQVRDLTPLKDMPLTWLDLFQCYGVRDLTPLQGMNLTEVVVTPKNIAKGMDILHQMKSLKTIDVNFPPKLTAAEFWKKYDNGEFK